MTTEQLIERIIPEPSSYEDLARSALSHTQHLPHLSDEEPQELDFDE